MLEALTWLFRVIGIAPIARHASQYHLSIVGCLITATHISVVLYCCCVYTAKYFRYPFEFRIPGVISDIYLGTWWYLTGCFRIALVTAVLTTSGRYVKARNKILVLKQKWTKLQTHQKRGHWVIEISALTLLVSFMLVPFGLVAGHEPYKSWEIFVVHNCDTIYIAATLIHFLLCLYEVKVNFDHIVDVLMKRIE